MPDEQAVHEIPRYAAFAGHALMHLLEFWAYNAKG
jgi:hypothetical protein